MTIPRSPDVLPLSDAIGRRFEYLRLSLTEVCNFRCTYCLPDGYKKPCQRPAELTVEEIRRAVTAFAQLGLWKVRLTGGDSGAGDYHTAHIHPQGIVSSALYLVVPEEAADAGQKLGWLEVGRPPPDLRLDLEPLRVICPQEAHLALFPSTLYHGTTPFGASRRADAERMTVAFDVVTSEDDRA